MKKRYRASAVTFLAAFSIIFGALFFSLDSGGAIDPTAAALEGEGTAAFAAGDFDLARRRFGEAEAAATRAGDWDTLIFLSFDYLALIPLDPGHENDNDLGARTAFVNATSIAYDKAIFSSDRPGSGRDCPDGLAGAIVGVFDALLAPVLPPGSLADTFRAQRDIAATVTCIPDPALSPSPSPSPATSPSPIAPTPSPSAAITFNFDKPFGTPQFFLHAKGHETINGPVVDDFYFLFPQKPDDKGDVLLPDGFGGTFTYHTDSSAGPFTTPREVCGAAKGRGVGDKTFNAWNSNESFDCSQLN